MKVSVLVVTYRHERYIGDALDGILSQETDFEVEVIVGDDCSDDGTRRVIRDYQSRHPGRIRTVFPEANLGDGGKPMFAETVRIARGEFLAVLDGDDYWTSPSKLQRQVEFLERHPECPACFHDVLMMREDGSAPSVRYNGEGFPTWSGLTEAIRLNFVAACAPMFRRGVIQPLPASFWTLPWGDYPLLIAAAECGPIGYIDEVMGVYRLHGEGLYSGLAQKGRLEQQVAFYEQLVADLDHDHRPVARHELAYRLFELAAVHNWEGDRDTARGLLRRSLAECPGRWKRRDLLRLRLWLSPGPGRPRRGGTAEPASDDRASRS